MKIVSHTRLVIMMLVITLLGTGATPLFSVCSQNISIIAHRGNSTDAPENTLAAFQSAIDSHADFIELDVHLCEEGIPCVIHDRDLSRTTNSKGQVLIEEISIGNLRELDAGAWFHENYTAEKVPTLEEVLSLPLGNTGVMIEVKAGSASPDELASAVTQIVRKFSRIKSGNPIIVGSIHPEIVKQLRYYLPELAIIAIIEDTQEIPNYRPARAEIYAVKHDLLTKKILNELEGEGKVVWTFTVDDTQEMHQMVDLGVSGIITNRPNDLIKIRRDLASECYDVINVTH